jgi:serpin B
MKPLLLSFLPLILLQGVAARSQEQDLISQDQKAVVQGNNAFAVDLYEQLRPQGGNLFFSPTSISTAFAMAYGGASGTTAAQMASTLHFTLTPARLHPAMGALLHGMNVAHDGYQLKVADALWAEKSYSFLPAYVLLTQADYAANFKTVDFAHAPDAVRATINRWVEDQTANKIKDLLAPGTVTPDTRLVLTNAIYFKGDWANQFDKSATQNEDFHLSAEKTVKAPLMHRTGDYGYFDGGTFQMLELPYKSGDLSMVVMLPKEIAGLAALEQSLTDANLERWFGQYRAERKVIVSLPKFTMTREFTLKETLEKLGMRAAFEPGAADFSGMTGKKDLWISDAVHKAFVDVNEEGTEAAAATGLVFRATAMAYQPPPVTFRADHPFVFLIRDNKSGGILFMGRVTDPTQ